MVRHPTMRASDVDREAAVTLLRDHHVVGRLTLAEFNERMGAAYEAVTLGELARLIADLPPPEHLEADVEEIRVRMAVEEARTRAARSRAPAPYPASTSWPVPRPAPPPSSRDVQWTAVPPARAPGGRSGGERALRAAWTTLNAVTAFNVAIWLLVAVAGTGVVYFWPVWVYGPAAAVLGSIQMFVWRHGRSSP
ncbi:DUF1707 domain-containing protein [Embleya sp. NBC_00896]|uniref:DUF1707 SHOCT-like domain-containing protein n=1 Tax=Embleya sp. NBC_00896 TaxID=2975961 RepID=UPI00386982BC|nr:DUF1707 domain-containing protein [Embleya sp. NBC_00896]